MHLLVVPCLRSLFRVVNPRHLTRVAEERRAIATSRAPGSASARLGGWRLNSAQAMALQSLLQTVAPHLGDPPAWPRLLAHSVHEFSQSNGAPEPVANSRPHLSDPPAWARLLAHSVTAASMLLTWLQGMLIGNRSTEKMPIPISANPAQHHDQHHHQH